MSIQAARGRSVATQPEDARQLRDLAQGATSLPGNATGAAQLLGGAPAVPKYRLLVVQCPFREHAGGNRPGAGQAPARRSRIRTRPGRTGAVASGGSASAPDCGWRHRDDLPDFG